MPKIAHLFLAFSLTLVCVPAAPVPQDAPAGGGAPDQKDTAKTTKKKADGKKTTHTDAAADARPQGATIEDFRAQPAKVHPGEEVTLLWRTQNATGVQIDGLSDSSKKLPAAGNLVDRPEATTEYTLTTTGPGKPATQKITVTVAEVTPGQPQSFTLPAFEKPVASSNNSTGTILAVAALFVIMAMALQVAAFMKLRSLRGLKLAGLDPLGAALSQLQDRATSASQLYSRALEAATRSTQQPPPPPPLPRPSVPPPQPASAPAVPVRPAPPSRPAAPGAAVLAEYERVRSSEDRGRDIDAFEAAYRSTRISCINLDDLRINPAATLRFQESPRGWQFMVHQDGQILAFPWFGIDLSQERDRLEGIFQYPAAGTGNLRVAKPAILEQRGGELLLTNPGVLESNG